MMIHGTTGAFMVEADQTITLHLLASFASPATLYMKTLRVARAPGARAGR